MADKIYGMQTGSVSLNNEAIVSFCCNLNVWQRDLPCKAGFFLVIELSCELLKGC